MENEPLAHSRREFNYTPSSIFTNQWSNLAFGIGMIVIPAIFPFGLRIRHLRLLSPALFSTILIAGGALLLLFTYFNLRKARLLKKHGGKITVNDGQVTYPVVKGNNIEYRSFRTDEIRYIKHDDEENQCSIALPADHIVLEVKYFDSWEEFEAFRSLLG